MATHLALLRGINVGGKNIIKMTDLKACFEQAGFTDVTTFIQSGNVVFTTAEKKTDRVAAIIEAAMAKRFKKDIRTLVLAARELRAMVKGAPRGFGTAPHTHRYNVLFLFKPLTSAAAHKAANPRPDVDDVRTGKGVLYFSYPMALATKSRMSKVITTPEYKLMTIRNWNTTTKLLALMERPVKK